MAHHLDTIIASDLSYLVLERRARDRELGAQVLDSTNQRLYPLPSVLVQRETFMADRDTITDSWQGERVTDSPTRVWRRERK